MSKLGYIYTCACAILILMVWSKHKVVIIKKTNVWFLMKTDGTIVDENEKSMTAVTIFVKHKM